MKRILSAFVVLITTMLLVASCSDNSVPVHIDVDEVPEWLQGKWTSEMSDFGSTHEVELDITSDSIIMGNFNWFSSSYGEGGDYKLTSVSIIGKATETTYTVKQTATASRVPHGSPGTYVDSTKIDTITFTNTPYGVTLTLISSVEYSGYPDDSYTKTDGPYPMVKQN